MVDDAWPLMDALRHALDELDDAVLQEAREAHKAPGARPDLIRVAVWVLQPTSRIR